MSSLSSLESETESPIKSSPPHETPRQFSGATSAASDHVRSPSIRSMLASLQTAPLSKMNTQALGGLSVKELYGDMTGNDINLRRTATRNTILDSLLTRIARSISERQADPEADVAANDGSNLDGYYHELPDTSVPTKDYGVEFSDIDPELVTWDGPDDPMNPRNWPTNKKSLQTGVVAIYTLLSPMSSSILSPAMSDISESLNITSSTIESLCVSIMVLAWALGPLIIAPASESDRVGRAPVLNASIWIGAIFNLACGFAKTPAQLCVLRFLGGLSGCAPLNVGAGSLADLWSDEHRQTAMSLYSLAPTMGPIIAPVISGFVVTDVNWHWCFWVLAIFNFAVAAVGTVIFKETYAPKLLRDKAKRLRKESGNPHLHTIYEIADGETTMGKLYVTVLRPISLIVGHPMVFGLGAFMAFVYGFMYLLIVTFPSIFEDDYGMSVEIAGLMYLPLGVGYVLGTIFFQFLINAIYKRLTARNGGVPKPEYRLPCLVLSGILVPSGLIIFGWSAEKKTHWIVPAIGAAIFGFVLVAVFQTIQLYLIDMNNRFAASSVAAAAVFRSLFGFSFPLFAGPMYAKLGYGWGNTLCAFVALALGIPFPLFCLFYGERLRLWANKRFDRKQAIRDARNLERLRQMNGGETEKTKLSETSQDLSLNL